jgi:hypothetical protein
MLLLLLLVVGSCTLPVTPAPDIAPTAVLPELLLAAAGDTRLEDATAAPRLRSSTLPRLLTPAWPDN